MVLGRVGGGQVKLGDGEGFGGTAAGLNLLIHLGQITGGKDHQGGKDANRDEEEEIGVTFFGSCTLLVGCHNFGFLGHRHSSF